MVPGDAAWVEMFFSEVRERLNFSHVKSADFHSSCPTLPTLDLVKASWISHGGGVSFIPETCP